MNATDMGVDDAKKQHAALGYKPYRGRKLQGPRFILPFGDAGYPPALIDIPHAPETLYGIGNPGALKEGLAVVGARKMTPYGKMCCTRFAGFAAKRGITIISGGARGCDSIAHEVALQENCPTVVFLGGGCDCPYPTTNVGLFQRVVDSGGAVVSEHPWDFPALPYTFRARNRLIAGLAKATLIVEAGLPSGTFSTADEALAANKEVLVVPGAITSPTSAGANRLLYQGATPVVDDETFSDVLFNLYGCLKQEQAVMMPVAEDSALRNPSLQEAVCAALNADPMRIDDLLLALQQSGFAKIGAADVMVCLATLQVQGGIARYPDGRYGPSL